MLADDSLQEEVNKLAPKLAEYLAKVEEEKKKEAEEAKNFVYVPQSKDDREPRTKKERMEAAKKRKEQGNVFFRDGNFEDAVLRYSQAVAHCDQLFDLTDEQKKEVQDLKISCYLNLSASYIKLKKYERARENAAMALKMEGSNVKALFRRGQAHYYLREFEEAKEDLSKAAKLEPKNAEVLKQLKQVQEQLALEKEKQKKMFSKMFA
jgi:tetratricopeptide (TPR) repeat protein